MTAKHIRQRKSSDCGIAVFAMLLGKSYKYIEEKLQKYIDNRKGLKADDTPDIFTLGLDEQIDFNIYDRRRFEEVDFGSDPTAVLVRKRPNSSRGHWVLVVGRTVHDPSRPRPLSRAKWNGNSEWVVCSVRPVRRRDLTWRDERRRQEENQATTEP